MADKDHQCAKAVTIVLRIAALLLSVAAAVVMGTASELVVLDNDAGGRRGWSSSYLVKYSHYTALVYFVAAVAIAAVFAAVGLYTYAVNAGAVVPLLDVLAQGLLFSAAGAAFAARVDVSPPPAGTTWSTTTTGTGGVCDAASTFCGRVTIGAAVGTGAAVAVSLAALASSSSCSRDGLRNLQRHCDF